MFHLNLSTHLGSRSRVRFVEHLQKSMFFKVLMVNCMRSWYKYINIAYIVNHLQTTVGRNMFGFYSIILVIWNVWEVVFFPKTAYIPSTKRSSL